MRHLITFALLSICAFGNKSYAADTPSGDSFSAGIGLAYVPEYAGADKSRVLPLPFLEKTYANGVFLSTQRGVGYETKAGDFKLSAALSYGGVREDHKKNYFSGSDALRGMGKIEGAAQAVLGVGYQLGSVGLDFTSRQNLNHRENGNTYSLSANMPLYSDSTDQIGFGMSATYGDRKHMQTYYGVTAIQSKQSGYRQYTAKAGFENVTAGVNWNHVLDANWSVHTGLGVNHLTSDAADSPLTKRKTTPMVMTALIYKF
jgi:outer membrane scaffolding protein for murein synthesis (MipA/OmpV family)